MNKYLVILLCILALLGYFQSKLGEQMVKKIANHGHRVPKQQTIIDSDDRKFQINYTFDISREKYWLSSVFNSSE